jgi:hypothetical protein
LSNSNIAGSVLGLDRLLISLAVTFNFMFFNYHLHRADPASNIRTSQMQTVGGNTADVPTGEA